MPVIDLLNSVYQKFNNAVSGLSATNVQDAIDELAGQSLSDSEVKTAYENNANTNAFTDAEKSKLGGIESNATADQTAAEIKTAYESNANTNAFTDAEQSKLAGIESGATADQTKADIDALEIDAGTLDGFDSTSFLRSDAEDIYTPTFFNLTDGSASIAMDSQLTPDGRGIKRITCNDGGGNWNFRSNSYFNAGEKYAVTGSGATHVVHSSDSLDGAVEFRVAVAGTADAAISWANTFRIDTSDVTINTNTVWHAGNSEAFTTAEQSKLAGIESGATADQTKADIDALGVDAATLGGQAASNYLRSNATDTYTGGLLTVKNDAGQDVLVAGQINGLQIRQDTAGADALMSFHVSGDYAFHFGLDGDTNDLVVGGWSLGSGNKYKVWHEGNDGNIPKLDQINEFSSDIRIREGSPTLHLRDIDNYGAFLHNNSGIMYILRGVQDGTTWDSGPNGRHPMNMNLGSGNVTFSGNVTAYSDVRFKEDIEPIADALKKVEAINGVNYTAVESRDRRSGVIAQEVEKVLPEVVTTDEDGYKAVSYGNMVGLLIEAVKELSGRVRELETK